jgi:hypothetical protein
VRSSQLPEFFAHQSEADLLDHGRLAAMLQPECKITRMRWRGSRLRLIQFPSEFSSLLLAMHHAKVRSYLEVGVSSGGSLFTADAYLRRLDPGFGRSLGVDRINKIRHLDEYRAIHPQLEFLQCNSKRLRLGDQRFDAAFIDARHVEKWVLQDFEKVRRNCRMVAFHDIVLQGSTVGLAWERIKDEHPGRWEEFVDQQAPPEARCGIGLVRLE